MKIRIERAGFYLACALGSTACLEAPSYEDAEPSMAVQESPAAPLAAPASAPPCVSGEAAPSSIPAAMQVNAGADPADGDGPDPDPSLDATACDEPERTSEASEPPPNWIGMVQGAIAFKYAALQGPDGVLGYPTTYELGTRDGLGRYNDFEHGSIYWTDAGGAYLVYGDVRQKWIELQAEAGLGYPTRDTSMTPSGVGRYSHFERGSIYFSPATGAWEVHGQIFEAWAADNYESGPLGFPVSDEIFEPDTGRRYNRFEHGTISVDANGTSIEPTPEP